MIWLLNLLKPAFLEYLKPILIAGFIISVYFFAYFLGVSHEKDKYQAKESASIIEAQSNIIKQGQKNEEINSKIFSEYNSSDGIAEHSFAHSIIGLRRAPDSRKPVFAVSDTSGISEAATCEKKLRLIWEWLDFHKSDKISCQGD